MTSPPCVFARCGVTLSATAVEANKKTKTTLRNTRPQTILHLRRHLRPIELEILRRQLPRVAAQQHGGEDRHHVRREVEAGAAVAGDRPGALRREGVLVAPLLGALGREAA